MVTIVKAIDRDEARNGYVEYSLESTDAPFVLGNVDGVLRVFGQLDREITANYTLKITARDRGDTPRSTVQILTVIVTDDNDNSPVFENRRYEISVAENANVGLSIIKVGTQSLYAFLLFFFRG